MNQDQNRTLGGSFVGGGEDAGQGGGVSHSLPMVYNAYLTVFSNLLSNRYPFVTDIETIDPTEVEAIVDLAAACTPIVASSWSRLSGVAIRSQRLRPQTKQTRAA